ncbi:MAG: hypothetical protein MEP57_09545 [Microvirga sp.]|nr:hypothetical protein [Microvirga sp.]
MSIFDDNIETFLSDLEKVSQPDSDMMRHRKAARRRGGVLTVVDDWLKRRHGAGRWVWSAGAREDGRMPTFDVLLEAHAVLRSVAGYGTVPRVGKCFARCPSDREYRAGGVPPLPGHVRADHGPSGELRRSGASAGMDRPAPAHGFDITPLSHARRRHTIIACRPSSASRGLPHRLS